MGGALLPQPAAAATPPLMFGMDVGAVTPMKASDIHLNYATMWVGVWTLKSGWAGTDAQLDRLHAAGVTPVIHFYYWGNDISKNCLENGCYSSIHNSWKSKAGWQELAQGLADSLNAHMDGRAAVIVIETEFNKNDVATYEALDGYLAAKANFFEDEYPASRPTLGFGNWGASNWGVFDRAAEASTFVGIQGMRGSTRDSVSSYTGVVGSLLTSVKTLKDKFGKPVFVTDIALSSHWEPDWLKHQASTIKSLMDRRAEFKSAGAVAIMYRGLYDAPNANINEYYGEGERHFGLAWSANKTWKPAMKAWVAGIKAERGITSSTSTSASSSTFAASFTPAAVGNNWWVEAKVTSSSTIAKVEVNINGAGYKLLERTDWGTWAKSYYAPDGSKVVFRATNAAGATDTSSTYTW